MNTAMGRRMAAPIAAMVALLAIVAPVRAQDAAVIARGEYVFNAGGCVRCHTDFNARGPRLAGGARLKTPFGTFFGPNITPHPVHGIGKWSDADFIRAMRDGIAPDGTFYFPVFPYTSFTNVTNQDLTDLKAYLFSQPAIERPSRAHEVGFPFSWRLLQSGWRFLHFTPGPFTPDATKSAEINRGAYLARALAHCGECHTPRNALGGFKDELWMAGTRDGPEGAATPNLTPDLETGIGKWSARDIAFYLKTGVDPEGDSAGSLMAVVIEHGTAKLGDADRAAIAAYLKSLAPIKNAIRKAAQ